MKVFTLDLQVVWDLAVAVRAVLVSYHLYAPFFARLSGKVAQWYSQRTAMLGVWVRFLFVLLIVVLL